MNGQPAANFNANAPVCDAGQAPTNFFTDDLEGGTGNWTFTNGTYTRWQQDSGFFGQYAQSGQHSLYADDYPGVITDAQARLASFVVPNYAYLHFAHAYDFEFYPSGTFAGNYDGGVLEYTKNGGATWIDAGSLMQYNGYKGTIKTGYSNPLANRSAFVGVSHGYISTRVNLKSLAGQTVSFRWRMGLDNGGYAMGWWVDNVRVYTCSTFTDVTASHPFYKYIEAFAKKGITTGCSASPKKYCPDALVNRGEMAVFIERAMGNFNPNPVPNGMFDDLPYPGMEGFTKFIEEFYNDKITTGCSSDPLMYCPQNNGTRGEMAVFIERAIGHRNPTPSPSGMFDDVPYPGMEGFTKFIEQLYNDKITTGCSADPLRYCPQNNVTRGEMAVFIVKAFKIPTP